MTRVYRPRRDMGIDPVVGWVAVTKGPGKGASFALGYGMNQIGRDRGQKVALDFGDEEIKRDGHAQIVFDHVATKFHLLHGGGRNLTYVGTAPLLQPRELTGGEEITLGKTTLRFAPLCGPGFRWEEDDS